MFKYATLHTFRSEWKHLGHASGISAMMQLWIKVASALPYTDDVGWSAVATLLNKRPVLNPESAIFRLGTTRFVV